MEYNNPNDPWMNQGYDPYKGLDEHEKVIAVLLQVISVVVSCIVGLLLCCLFSSCTTTQYVPVVETHEQHHWHTDSIHHKDSIIRETNTTIMELDSAAMAQYGIQLKSAERAWLVRTQELERQLQQMARLIQDRNTVHDSIPVPTPVIKEVPAQLTWWQEARLHLANIMLYVLLIVGIIWIGKKHLGKYKG